jgi:hypothetical protein
MFLPGAVNPFHFDKVDIELCLPSIVRGRKHGNFKESDVSPGDRTSVGNSLDFDA